MKIGIIAFTKKGGKLNETLCSILKDKGYEVCGYIISKYSKELSLTSFDHLDNITKQLFKTVEGIVFVGACGIAVRAIAPYIQSKTIDPAVVVLDEDGKYAISLLSGHIGGANELAKLVADIIGAQPVITTATDINNKFAVDNWAVKNKLYIVDIAMVKLISSSILNGDVVGFHSDFPIQGKLPMELTYDVTALGINISKSSNNKTFQKTLNLMPKNIVLGIGCKKNTPFDKIDAFINATLEKHTIDSHRVEKVCSIDIKAEEKGIVLLAEKLNVRFEVFTAEKLNAVKGTFTTSDFVKSKVGVDNVCERSAVLGSDYGNILINKTAFDGMTVAVCEKGIALDFEVN